ncbi:MAG: hypothetical protein ISN64_02080 [Rickettsia sp.]|nr:hypothetical protein [Rickettsia sp.]
MLYPMYNRNIVTGIKSMISYKQNILSYIVDYLKIYNFLKNLSEEDHSTSKESLDILLKNSLTGRKTEVTDILLQLLNTDIVFQLSNKNTPNIEDEQKEFKKKYVKDWKYQFKMYKFSSKISNGGIFLPNIGNQQNKKEFWQFFFQFPTLNQSTKNNQTINQKTIQNYISEIEDSLFRNEENYQEKKNKDKEDLIRNIEKNKQYTKILKEEGITVKLKTEINKIDQILESFKQKDTEEQKKLKDKIQEIKNQIKQTENEKLKIQLRTLELYKIILKFALKDNKNVLQDLDIVNELFSENQNKYETILNIFRSQNIALTEISAQKNSKDKSRKSPPPEKAMASLTNIFYQKILQEKIKEPEQDEELQKYDLHKYDDLIEQKKQLEKSKIFLDNNISYLDNNFYLYKYIYNLNKSEYSKIFHSLLTRKHLDSQKVLFKAYHENKYFKQIQEKNYLKKTHLISEKDFLEIEDSNSNLANIINQLNVKNDQKKINKQKGQEKSLKLTLLKIDENVEKYQFYMEEIIKEKKAMADLLDQLEKEKHEKERKVNILLRFEGFIEYFKNMYEIKLDVQDPINNDPHSKIDVLGPNTPITNTKFAPTIITDTAGTVNTSPTSKVQETNIKKEQNLIIKNATLVNNTIDNIQNTTTNPNLILIFDNNCNTEKICSRKFFITKKLIPQFYSILLKTNIQSSYENIIQNNVKLSLNVHEIIPKNNTNVIAKIFNIANIIQPLFFCTESLSKLINKKHVKCFNFISDNQLDFILDDDMIIKVLISSIEEHSNENVDSSMFFCIHNENEFLQVNIENVKNIEFDNIIF